MRFVQACNSIRHSSSILSVYHIGDIAMAKFQNSYTLSLFIISTLLVQAMGDAPWEAGSATFYGDMTGKETMQGACGYGDLIQQGYGLETAALSTALFNNGLTCGACFEIMCVNDPQWCIPNAGTIKITGTNFCPPNYDPHFYPWCNPPRKHFDLSMPMFVKIAQAKAGIIPVQFRRTPCVKQGGIRFQLSGNPNFVTATVLNVAGAGDVTAISVKTPTSNWLPMSRNWGQLWAVGGQVPLIGQVLSFQVTTSDQKTLVFNNVAPGNWQFGQTYEAAGNF